MKLTKKQIPEFRKLIKKARKLDNEFMESTLPIRLEFTWDLETSNHNEWLELRNNLFRTDLKTWNLKQPNIRYSKHIGLNDWEEKYFEPMELNLKEVVEKGFNLK